MIPKINKILYATDLAANSQYAFRYAVSSAEKHDARVDVLYALDMPVLDFESPSSAFAQEDPDKREIIEKIRKRIKDFAEQELRGKPSLIDRVSTIYVIEGDPSAVILQAIDDLNPDVLIMGTHSKGIIAQTFLGSVAMRVLQRSRIPVYVIPIPVNKKEV